MTWKRKATRPELRQPAYSYLNPEPNTNEHIYQTNAQLQTKAIAFRGFSSRVDPVVGHHIRTGKTIGNLSRPMDRFQQKREEGYI